MKIRIFTLSKELNIDSKVLIEACQKLGIILKNSALASITPEERDQVLASLKQSAPAEVVAPAHLADSDRGRADRRLARRQNDPRERAHDHHQL